ncbi:hypothetical protein BH18GEM1_BH18GEM1_21020 [soil metagenome]
MAMTRRKFLGAVAVVGAGSAAGLEGFLVEPHSLEVTHHKVGREDPSGGPTLRIVQITDLHLEDVNDHVVRVAEAVNRSLPDIVTITGDSVNGARGLGALGDFLDLLASGPPKYAIYGNWERWAGIDPGNLGATYEARNGRLLVNESVVHQQGGAEVLITGLDDMVEGEPDYARAMAARPPAPNHLLLEHCPEFRDHLAPSEPIPSLMLSGHTHGGQVNLFGWAPVLPRGSGRYVRGWYRDRQRGGPVRPDLYVSRGIGTVTLPVRFGSPPEIAVFDWSLAA